MAAIVTEMICIRIYQGYVPVTMILLFHATCPSLFTSPFWGVLQGIR
jgi:hypothetical protein